MNIKTIATQKSALILFLISCAVITIAFFSLLHLVHAATPLSSTRTCNGDWEDSANGSGYSIGFKCVTHSKPKVCASGLTMRNGQCVAASCPMSAPISCLSSEHIEYNGCSQRCVLTTREEASVSDVSCKTGYTPSGFGGHQECVPVTANPPTLSASISATTLSAGSYGHPGDSAQITWTTQNAPQDSATALYLVPADGSKGEILLASKLPSTGSYSWTNVGPVCAKEGCQLLLGGPGTYQVVSKLYSPSDACLGDEGICPGKRHMRADILSVAQTSTITIAPSASGATSGTLSTSGATTVTGTTPLAGGSAGVGLTIILNWDTSVASAPPEFKSAATAVAQDIASHYADPITVTINVGYGEVNGYAMTGALGMSSFYIYSTTYAGLKNALSTDAVSGDDSAAVATLPGTDPAGGVSYWMSSALYKALKLSSGTSLDGSIGLASQYPWDYNRTDGITTGYDFQGTVAHEITEVLGRLSMRGGSYAYAPVTLFNFSSPSVRNLAGNGGGYLSVDNGVTTINTFNAGSSGDTTDWAGSTNDSFNAFSSTVLNPVSEGDWRWLDVIGYDRIVPSTAVTASLSVSPTTIATGQSAALSWTSSNATACTGTNFSTPSLAGSVTVTPTITTTYSISCSGASGSIAKSATVTVTTPDTQAPSVPTGLSGSAISSSQNNLSWSASTDNVGVIGYTVYRNGTAVGTPTGTTYSDSGLIANTAYIYMVTARDVAGNTSAQSIPLSITTPQAVATIAVGARVTTKVAGVNVRSSASSNRRQGKILCTKPLGAQGTIISGPQSNSGFVWWNINFDTGCDGWVAQNYFTPLLAFNAASIPSVTTSNTIIPVTQPEIQSKLSALYALLSNLQSFLQANIIRAIR